MDKKDQPNVLVQAREFLRNHKPLIYVLTSTVLITAIIVGISIMKIVGKEERIKNTANSQVTESGRIADTSSGTNTESGNTIICDKEGETYTSELEEKCSCIDGEINCEKEVVTEKVVTYTNPNYPEFSFQYDSEKWSLIEYKKDIPDDYLKPLNFVSLLSGDNEIVIKMNNYSILDGQPGTCTNNEEEGFVYIGNQFARKKPYISYPNDYVDYYIVYNNVISRTEPVYKNGELKTIEDYIYDEGQYHVGDLESLEVDKIEYCYTSNSSTIWVDSILKESDVFEENFDDLDREVTGVFTIYMKNQKNDYPNLDKEALEIFKTIKSK